MINIRLSAAAAIAAATMLSACGTTTSDRAISGGLIGAGAAVGAATTPSQVDLGDPVWREHHHCVEYDHNNNCLRWAPND